MDIVIKDLKIQRGDFCLNIKELIINKGEKVAVVGLNGSGKTTLFDCLLGLLNYSGTISLLGNCPKKDFKKVVPKVAYCMQNPDDQLFCSTIKEDILFAPRNFGLLKKESETSIVERVASLMDISHFLNKAPSELSYGEKKRCTIASCLSYAPEILLLDEPTAMLDNKQKQQLGKVLGSLNNITLLVATHDHEWVKGFCNKELFLEGGKLGTYREYTI